ncbi:MAG TPA: sigma 54-interacting transcriptional regulator [Terracidiphilus sp.]|nr:sigma 54-interacting transcriptional regulator [Terracidiphilus sp.]
MSSDSKVLESVLAAGESNCWHVEITTDAWEAMAKIQASSEPDMLLLDLPPESGNGTQILRTMQSIRPNMPIVVIGHLGDEEWMQELTEFAAPVYLRRPFEDGRLEAAIRRSLDGADQGDETDITSEDIEEVGNGRYFIGVTTIMRKLRTHVASLARIDAPVFISGEPGSGKETVACMLHRLSLRSGFEFTRVNCGALPEDLLEVELFGGATPYASPSPRLGKLEQCQRGTVFLDAIAEMPLNLQSKLALALETGRFAPRGSRELREVSARILAASSLSMHEAVSQRKLVPELYRLLCRHELHVPALRERKKELPVLSRHLMHRLANHYIVPPRELTPAVVEAWQAYDWPGNLRELEQAVKRYLVAGGTEFGHHWNPADGAEATPGVTSTQRRDKGLRIDRTSGGGICGYKSLRDLLQSVKEEAEKNAIGLALQKTGWNRKAAARLLKTSYRSVLYKIEQYQMNSSNSPQYPSAGDLETEEVGLHGNGHRESSVPNVR